MGDAPALLAYTCARYTPRNIHNFDRAFTAKPTTYTQVYTYTLLAVRRGQTRVRSGFRTKATSYTQVYIYTLLAVELPGTRLKLSRSLLGDYKSRKQPFPQLYLISSTLSSAASLDNGALEASTTQSSEPAAAGIYTP